MKILAAKYFKEFKCIASECEASCCDYPWTISVDQKHYKKIRKFYSNSKKDKEEFKKNISRIKMTDISKEKLNYAKTNQSSSGTCNFLDNDKLCGLIKKSGESLLPLTCKNYPRNIKVIPGKKIEAGLELSCPEATRKCLLDSDSHRLVEVNQEELGSNTLQGVYGIDDYYIREADYIKQYAVNMLQDKRYSLKSRLFMLTYYCNKTKDFLFKNVLEDPSLHLTKVHQLLESDGIKDSLDQQLKEINIPSEIGMGLLHQCMIIQPAIGGGHSRLLSEMFMDVVFNCFSQIPGRDINDKALITSRSDMLGFWNYYLLRKTIINDNFGNRIESRLTQYCTHYWMTNWHTKSDNLLLHIRQCLMYKAIICFLLYCNPELNIISKKVEDVNIEKYNELIDSVLVKAVYAFSRDTANQSGIANLLEKHLDDNQLIEFAPIMLLIDF